MTVEETQNNLLPFFNQLDFFKIYISLYHCIAKSCLCTRLNIMNTGLLLVQSVKSRDS